MIIHNRPFFFWQMRASKEANIKKHMGLLFPLFGHWGKDSRLDNGLLPTYILALLALFGMN